MSVRRASHVPVAETGFADATTIPCGTAGTWWLLGATTGVSGTDGSVDLPAGYYLIRAEWFSNVAGNGGVFATINGVQVGHARDARFASLYSSEGWVLHPGGSMTYSIRFSREANVTFGLSNDDRWGRRLTITGPFPLPQRRGRSRLVPPSESVFTDSTVVTANTVANWWLLGTTTGTGGSAASVDKAPGLYLCRGEWFVNTNRDGGVYMKINGTQIGNHRDARSGRFFETQGWILHPGGNMTYEIYFASETTNAAVFGLAGDARWARRLTIIGPFPSVAV